MDAVKRDRLTALIQDLAARSNTIQSLERTVADLLDFFQQAGFEHVLISVYDRRRDLMIALDGSGDMYKLVKVTTRDVHGSSVTPDDDILVYVLKTGLRKDVADCFDLTYRCDQSAIRLLDPPLNQQVILPLRSSREFGWPQSRVFGTVSVGRVSLPLADDDSNLLRDLCRYAAIILEDALLYQDQQRLLEVRDRQLRLLQLSSAAVNKSRPIRDTLSQMLYAAVEGIGGSLGSIRLYDPLLDRLIYRAVVGHEWGRDELMMTYPIDETSTAGWIVKYKRPTLNSDTSKMSIPYLAVFASTKSNCGVPIRINGVVDGALVVDADRVRAFTLDDVSILEAVGDLIGALINNSRSRSLDETRSRVVDLLDDFQLRNNKLQDIAMMIRRSIAADHCSIFLRSQRKAGELLLRATTSPSLIRSVGAASYQSGEGRTGWVVQTESPLRINAGLGDNELRTHYGSELIAKNKYSEYPANNPALNLLAVPILSQRGGCWGVIRCTNRFDKDPGAFFSQEEQEILELVATEIAITLDRRVELRSRRYRDRKTVQDLIQKGSKALATTINPAITSLVGSLRGCQRLINDNAAPEQLREQFDRARTLTEDVLKATTELNQELFQPQARCVLLDLPAALLQIIGEDNIQRRISIGNVPIDWPRVSIDPSMLRIVCEEVLRCLPDKPMSIVFEGPIDSHNMERFTGRPYVSISFLHTADLSHPTNCAMITDSSEVGGQLETIVIRGFVRAMGGAVLEMTHNTTLPVITIAFPVPS